MTTQEFCESFEKHLLPLPKEEREEIVSYYSEFLDEADEGERERLGTPETLAQRILEENGISISTFKRRFSAGRVALLVSTAVIWVPLWVCWYVLLATLFICIVAVCISFLLGFVAFLWDGAMYAERGNIPLGLFLFGLAFLLAGILVLLRKPFWTALCWSLSLFPRSTKWLWKKGRNYCIRHTA